MKDFSYVMSSHPSYIESMYNDYVKDASTVDPEWKKFFEGFDFAMSKSNGNGSHTAAAPSSPVSSDMLAKEVNVFRLIRSYWKRGHLVATTNPIRPRKDRQPHLDLRYFDLTDADLNLEFHAGSYIGLGKAKLSDIIAKLQKLYTANIGIEFTYINNYEETAAANIQHRPAQAHTGKTERGCHF
jgi:2-oxoglutarate dehydrogenase E1 component